MKPLLLIVLMVLMVLLGGCQPHYRHAASDSKPSMILEPELTSWLSRGQVIAWQGEKKISQAQMMQRAEAWFANGLRRWDMDQDGMLTRAELVHGLTHGPGAVIWSGMDANKDRRISRAEVETYVQRDAEAIVNRYDSNGDGLVSRAEFLAVIQQEFSKQDADKDGVIRPEDLGANMVPRSVAAAGKPQYALWSCGPGCNSMVIQPYFDLENPCTRNPSLPECPSTTHPGCTNGDVSSGNCVCPFPGECEPFF